MIIIQFGARKKKTLQFLMFFLRVINKHTNFIILLFIEKKSVKGQTRQFE